MGDTYNSGFGGLVDYCVYTYADYDDKRNNSGELLKKALAAYLHKEEHGDVLRPARGKPCIPGGPDFSVSHSGRLWAVALGGAPVGLDVQHPRKVEAKRIARRFFTPHEYAYLEAEGFDRFFELWTAKESYVKFTGRGIGGFEGFSVIVGLDDAEIRQLDRIEGAYVCLCAQRIGEVIIRPLL